MSAPNLFAELEIIPKIALAGRTEYRTRVLQKEGRQIRRCSGPVLAGRVTQRETKTLQFQVSLFQFCRLLLQLVIQSSESLCCLFVLQDCLSRIWRAVSACSNSFGLGITSILGIRGTSAMAVASAITAVEAFTNPVSQ